MAKIVEVGSFNMDLVVRMPSIPRPGETLLGGVFSTFPGGKGSNQAVAAARLGGDVAMIGRVGSDAFGDQLGDAGLVEGHVALLQPADPPGVVVHAGDAQSELGEARPGDQPHVPRPDDTNMH